MNITKVPAWRCKCGKSFLAKDIAETCCVIRNCDRCGVQVDRPYYLRCYGCRELAAIEKFAEAERGPTDTFVYSDALTKYIEVDYVEDQWANDSPLFEVGSEVLLETIIEHWRLYACKPSTPNWLGVSEWGCDDLGEDAEEPPGNYQKVDKAFYDYLASCGAWCYYETKIRWDGS